MKILYLSENAHAYKSEGRAYDIDLIRQLGAEATIVVYTTSNNVPQMSVVEHDGVKYYISDKKKRLPALALIDSLLKRITGIRKLLTDIFNIRKILLAERPDIVQAEAVIPYGFCAYCATKVTAVTPKIVVSVHQIDGLKLPFYHDGNSGTQKRIYNFIFKRCRLRAASYLVKQWLTQTGAPETQITVIPPNIDSEFLKLSRQAKRKKTLKFVSVSRYTPVKALDILIEAFAKALQEHPQATLDIYGQARLIPGIGDYKTYLQKLIDKKNLGVNIKLFDAVPAKEVPQTISAYDFNICSSYGETLNLVVVEACAVGVPSIVTNLCGISHWVQKHGSGITSDCDIEKLALALSKTMRLTESEYEVMSRNCYQLAQEFSPQQAAGRLLAFYGSLLQTQH